MLIITSCGKKNETLKGEDLKGSDALELLAGKTEKRWKLKLGEDFYKMICFSPNGDCRDGVDYKMKFTLSGNVLTFKEASEYVYKIVSVSEKILILTNPQGKELIYTETTDIPKKSENTSSTGKKTIDQKWIKGYTRGTTWKSSTGSFTYSFYNDGKFYDSLTGFKEEAWSFEGNKLKIGSSSYEIVELSAGVLEIVMGGTNVKLSYLGEAKEKPSDNKPNS